MLIRNQKELQNGDLWSYSNICIKWIKFVQKFKTCWYFELQFSQMLISQISHIFFVCSAPFHNNIQLMKLVLFVINLGIQNWDQPTWDQTCALLLKQMVFWLLFYLWQSLRSIWFNITEKKSSGIMLFYSLYYRP